MNEKMQQNKTPLPSEDITIDQLDEKQLKKLQISLRERTKELNCIFYMFNLVQQADTTEAEVIKGVLEIIPSSWQYSESTAARISIKEQEWHTSNFRITEWYQEQNIIVSNQKVGSLQVVYLEEKPMEDEGPFLKEERVLINQIVAIISMYLKKQEDKKMLQRNDETIRQITENIDNAVWLSSADQKQMFYISSAYEKIWGRTCESLYEDPTSFLESVFEEDKPTVYLEYEKYLQGNTFDLEYRIQRPDGKLRWIAVRTNAIKDDNGKIVRHAGMAKDITDRVERDIALKEKNQKLEKIIEENSRLRAQLEVEKSYFEKNEKLYRGLIESQLDYIVRFDIDYKFTFVNDVFCKNFGMSREELIGQLFTPFVHEDDVGGTLEALKEAEKPPYRAFSIQRDKTVTGWRWTSWEGYAIKNAKGETVEIQAVGRDITELKEAQKKAEEANLAKSQFLANMSHEIRTPMNVLIGMADLLDELIEEDEQKQYISIMKRNSENLLCLVNDALDLEKVEAGKLELLWRETNLCEFINQVGNDYKAMAKKQGLTLVVEMQEYSSSDCMVLIDQDRLRQVLVNLIGNAIKFTDQGEVRIRVAIIEHKTIQFSVQDTGIGIAESKLNDIFQVFYQADETSTRAYQGTGLGLAISKRIIERMGGHIWVESEIGKGSKFIFEFPYQPVDESLKNRM